MVPGYRAAVAPVLSTTTLSAFITQRTLEIAICFSVPARLFWIRGTDGFGRGEAVAVGHLDFRASQPSAGPGARRKGRPQPRIQSGSLSVHLHRKTQKVRSGWFTSRSHLHLLTASAEMLLSKFSKDFLRRSE